MPPDSDGVPRAEFGIVERHDDGALRIERCQLTPYGWPRDDGIDVLCVAWEGCGPDSGDGLRMCSSGCPGLERWYVRSGGPGTVVFDSVAFYSTLDGCLADSSVPGPP